MIYCTDLSLLKRARSQAGKKTEKRRRKAFQFSCYCCCCCCVQKAINETKSQHNFDTVHIQIDSIELNLNKLALTHAYTGTYNSYRELIIMHACVRWCLFSTSVQKHLFFCMLCFLFHCRKRHAYIHQNGLHFSQANSMNVCICICMRVPVDANVVNNNILCA